MILAHLKEFPLVFSGAESRPQCSEKNKCMLQFCSLTLKIFKQKIYFKN